MGSVPRNNNTGGVDDPSFNINGSVAGLKCVPKGDERSTSASRKTRCGSLYTPERRWIKLPSVSDMFVLLITQLIASFCNKYKANIIMVRLGCVTDKQDQLH